MKKYYDASVRSIIHHTTKYDGTIHYRFPVDVVAESNETIAVYRKPGVRYKSYRGEGLAENHLLILFYKNRHHNVVVSWSAEWIPEMHYLNITSPAVWDDRSVTAIDLDLDLIRRATGEVFVDDEDEFESHIERFHYPNELVDQCRDELSRLQVAMRERRGILSDRIFEWRPSSSPDDAMLVAV